MTDAPVLTIDGPSGSGKGTISCAIARSLGWHFLDSGALYRLVGLVARQRDIDLEDAVALAGIAENLDVSFDPEAREDLRTLLAGEPVDQKIRREEVATAASVVASMPGVRTALLNRQRSFQKPPGLVADGRDMGTVVFPDAPCKVFLTASVEERAGRRHKQLKAKGIGGNLRDLLTEIRARDERDSRRAVAPLMPADDAYIVDTTDLSINQAVERVLQIASETMKIRI